uniref:Pro-FMRFamide-related neuropeptide VF n=1 Tax=Ictidomys tridecemlineatus TaxID=43179 RepID=I3MCF4_ICTTR
MEIISSKRFILLTLATSSLLTSNIFCEDELLMPNLHSKENYNKHFEPRGAPKKEKEKSPNFQELKDWGPKNVMKMNTPSVNKKPHSAANLPLRFGRTVKEERSPGGTANLEIWTSISRHNPNLPQRFGRMTTAQSVTKTLSDLFQQSTHSLCASEFLYSNTCQSQENQNPDQKQPRRLVFKNIDDVEVKQEK